MDFTPHPSRWRQRSRASALLIALAVFVQRANAQSAYFSVTGGMQNSSQSMSFTFNNPTTSNLTLRTWANGGGTNAGGQIIDPGGIDSILTLYDSTFTQIAQNDEISFLSHDSRIIRNGQAPGNYLLTMGVSSNGIGTGRWATDLVSNNGSLALSTIAGNILGNPDGLAIGATGSARATFNLADNNLLIVGPITANSGATLNVATFLGCSTFFTINSGARLNLQPGGQLTSYFRMNVAGGEFVQSGGTANFSGDGLTVQNSGSVSLTQGMRIHPIQTWTIQGGGKLATSAYVDIGEDAGGTGTLLVTDAGSQYSAQGTSVWGNQPGGSANVQVEHDAIGTLPALILGGGGGPSDTGSGSLTIYDGATFTAGNLLLHEKGSIFIVDATFNCPGVCTLDGQLIFNGGTFHVGTFTSNTPLLAGALFQWSAGRLIIDSDLSIGLSRPLGLNVEVNSSRSLVVAGTTTIEFGGRLTLSNSSFTTGRLVQLPGGTLELSGANVVGITGPVGFGVGPGGDLQGNAITLSDITLNITNQLRVAPGGSLTLSSASLNIGSGSNAGQMNLVNTLATFGPAGLDSAATLNLIDATIAGYVTGGPSSAINVADHATFSPGASKAIKTHTLSIGGTLDLTNNSLIIDYTGPVGTLVNDVRQQLRSGVLTSSSADATHRLGYGDNATLGKTTFKGQTIDASSVLIKFTFAGDANLDGQVDVSDLGALATHWQTSAVWTGGNFNYDGFVDVADLGALATNWQAAVGSPLAPSRLDQALIVVGSNPAAVPEPAAIMISVASFSIRRHRARANLG